jgi:flagellar biosynthesis protein FlhA
VRELLDQFSERSPKIVEEIVPSLVSMSLLHRTLRSLLAERVSVRDLGSILETLAEYAPRIQDPDLLTDLVRERLGRTITKPYLASDGSLKVMTLAPDLEETLRAGVQRTESGSFLAVDPQVLDGLLRGVRQAVQKLDKSPDDRGPVLLASQAVRAPLRNLLGRAVPRLAVLSQTELPADVRIIATDVVRPAHAH